MFPNLSTYIGLFTGTLIAGLGVYLLLSPMGGGLPDWAAKGLPIFMLIYGGFRVGLSIYQLFRHRSWHKRQIERLSALVALISFTASCSSGPEANLRIRLDYGGDCATCPLSRMDSLLRVFFPTGFVGVQYDSTQHQVLIDVDSQYVKIDSLRQVLLAYGYEVNEEFPFDPILSPCCVVASVTPQAGESLLSGPSSEEIQEGMTLLEQELEAEIVPDPGATLEAELNLEEDLGGLEELDLSEDLGGDLGLEELDLGEDLGLEELDGSPPPKKKTPPPK